MTDDVTTGGGNGGKEADFECLIFISMHANLRSRHLYDTCSGKGRGGRGVRGGKRKPRGARREVSRGKWRKQ